jgi:hypothetical protein
MGAGQKCLTPFINVPREATRILLSLITAHQKYVDANDHDVIVVNDRS